jgi:hypothetical protein
MLNFYKLHTNPNELFGYKDAHLKVPSIAWKVANTNKKKQKLEHLWASDAEYAFKYAYEVLREPWEPGEEAIARESMYAFLYARFVIKTSMGTWRKSDCK